MAEFLFKPTPHKEAIAFIAGKPALRREQFDNLLPELKAFAFTIAGVQSFDVLKDIRDRVATLPAGGDWDGIKAGIAEQLVPYFVDPAEDAETQEKQRAAAERRAELLIRTHGSQAYAATAWRLADAQRDLFPYWRYQSLGDSHVRPSHAALDGIVLPADHEFWASHTPPWDWGCRCQFVPLSEDDVEDLKKEDEGKPPELRNVLDVEQQKLLTDQRTLWRPANLDNMTGHPVPYSVASPAEKGQEGAFSWQPGQLGLSLADLQERYDPGTWLVFQAWAQAAKIPGTPTTVWQWLEKKQAAAQPKPPKPPKAAKPAPVPAPPVLPPKPPAPAPAPAPAPVPLPQFPDPAQMKKVRGLGGSTGAELYEAPDGRLFVVKRGASASHLREEHAADELYRALGVPVPPSALLETPAGPVKVAEFIKGKTLSAATVDRYRDQIAEHFAADALLANWDVAGLSFDNLLVDDAGKVWRIDNGGSLRFRAQGGGKAFGPLVEELATLRDAAKNPAAARVFSGLTPEAVAAQVQALATRRDALLAAAPQGLRDVLARRLDDLIERTAPKKKAAKPAKKAAPAPAVPPAAAQFAEDVKKAGIAGRVALRDRGDIEDTQVLVWEESGAVGSKVVRAKLKLTPAGSAKLMQRLGQSLPEPAAGTPTDPYWSPILAAAKTVNKHAADGAYNSGTLAALETAKKTLGKLPASPIKTHYLAQIAQIEEAKAAKKATPVFAQFIPGKPEAAAVAPRDFKVERRKVDYTRKETSRGASKDTGEAIYSHDALLVDLDGMKIKITPFKEAGGADFSAPYALRGYVEILDPGPATEATLGRITGALGKLGIDDSPAGDAWVEAMYLRKGMQIRTDAFDAAARKKADELLADAALDDAARVAGLKAVVKDKLGRTLPDAPAPGYDWRPKAAGAGDGWHRTERWDIPRAEIEKEMAGYKLHHHTGRDLAEVLDSLLEGGGEFTSTTERLRRGIAISAGMSPQADLDTGGANYLFTRIQKAEKADRLDGFTFKIGNLARQDAFSFKGDRFGNVKTDEAYAERAKTIADFKAHSRNGSNETIFKWGMPILDELDTINVGSETAKKKVLAVFKKHGIEKLNDGRPVADAIKVTK